MKIAIISVTNQGDEVAQRINKEIQCTRFNRATVKELGLKNIVSDVFNNYDGIIFISSTGIAVRSIAEHLRSKITDPAVLVIDASGRYVISLLSGHLGGANKLALQVGNIINAEPVITTATDVIGVVAPDIIARDNDLCIESMEKCKEIASLIVEGKKVLFIDEDDSINTPKGYVSFKDLQRKTPCRHKEVNKNIIGDNKTIGLIGKSKDVHYLANFNKELIEDIRGIVLVTNKAQCSIIEELDLVDLPLLKLVRKNILLGIGCRKDYDSQDMSFNVKCVLKENNLHRNSILEISTVEIKSQEKAILDLVNEYKTGFKIYTIEEISKVDNLFEGSDFVKKVIGVRAVSDPCVYLSGGEILQYKTKMNGMTISIGKV